MRPIALLFFVSAITSLGIIFPPLWPLVFPGLGGFFYLLRNKTKQLGHAARYGLIFGTITGLAGTVWFCSTLPLDFLGIPNQFVQYAAVGMTWLYVGGSLGIIIGVAAPLVWAFRNLSIFPLVAATIWTAAELGRMWTFALTTWGPQSLLGPHFSAAAIGYPLAENSFLLQLASPYGLDALNFFVAGVAGILAIAPTTWRRQGHKGVFIAQVLLFISLPTLSTDASPPLPPKAQLRAAIISENIPDIRDTSTHAAVAAQLAQVAKADPPVDVIILPEEISLTSIFWSKNDAEKFLKEHFGTREALLLHTRNELFPQDEENSVPEPKKLVYETTSGQEIGRYIKMMLMPLGEYTPSFTKTFFSVIPDPDLHLFIDDVATLAGPPPNAGTVTATYRGVRIGGLLCSDMLSPRLYHSLARDRQADVLVNLSNQFWFHGSHTLHWKTMQMAKVHAVQNRLPLLVANNIAPSYVVNRAGAVIAQSKWGDREPMYVEIP